MGRVFEVVSDELQIVPCQVSPRTDTVVFIDRIAGWSKRPMRFARNAFLAAALTAPLLAACGQDPVVRGYVQDDRAIEQIKPGTPAAAPALAGHPGEGSINAIDLARSTVTIAHGPIASLKWPAMIMDFRVLDPASLRALKPGQKIAFDIIEESAGEYVIVRIQPAGASPAAKDHVGH